jgi:hypothetical protein
MGFLNYALTLEYLESTFDNEATANQHRTAFLNSSTVTTPRSHVS